MGKYTRSKKGRSRSRYRQRLESRGLTKTPVMRDTESLRRLQTRKVDRERLFAVTLDDV